MTGSDQTTVLLVDDDDGYRHSQAEWMREEYDVRTAANGSEGIDAYDEDVDVVILDRRMPDMPGREVAKELRTLPGSAQIIATTGVDPGVDVIDMGIDDYVTKPVSRDDMRTQIERALDRASFDEQLQGYFSLANKRDVLADQPEVRETEQFAELTSATDEKAREYLERREVERQRLLSASPAAIVTLDEEGDVDSWNPAASELFGWTEDEVVGNPPPMFRPENMRQLEQIRSRLFRDTVVSDIEVTCRTRTEVAVDVRLSATPLVADEEMYGTLFLFVDVTDRNLQAEQISVFSRVLRHNLRNDLNLLLATLTELEQEVPDELAATAADAVDVAQQLEGLTEKANSIQRTLSADREVGHVDVVDRARTQLSNAQTTFPSADFGWTSPPDEHTVLAATDIDEALWELLENAVVHNDDDPRVQLDVEPVQGIEHDWCRLSVADDGPGIPPIERQVLFTDAADNLDPGSGLGLWFVKWLADRSDAQLEFGECSMGGSKVSLLFRKPSG